MDWGQEQFVPDELNTLTPKIVFVGEAPGAEELFARPGWPHGRPFVGTAGGELDRMLQRVGIDRSQVCLLNIWHHKLPKNNFGVMYEDKGCMHPTPELERAWAELHYKLDLLKPNVVVPLGDIALHATMGMHGIGKFRGSILQTRGGIKCVPTYHPNGVVRSYDIRPIVLADLRRAKAESWQPEMWLPKRQYTTNPTKHQTLDYIQQAYLSKRVSFDIEVYHGGIACVGLSYSSDHAICIPFVNQSGRYWSDDDFRDICLELKGLLESKEVEKVAQNAHYDMCWLERELGIKVSKELFDTQVAQHSCYPELPKSLDFLASLYTREPYWKDENKDWRVIKDFDKLWGYNCKDAVVTFELRDCLNKEIDHMKVRENFNFEMKLVHIFAKNTLRGVAFDNDKRKVWLKEVKKQLKEQSALLDTLLPNDWVCKKCKGVGTINKKKPKVCPECKGQIKHINPASSPQMIELIFDRMGLPKSILPTKRSSDEDTIIKLAVKKKSPIFDCLLKIRALEQEEEFLLVKLDPDGRLRTTFSCSTETSRIASSKSPWQTGRNVQNIHRKASFNFRDLFMADPGKVMIIADFSQAEARTMAYESGDPIYIKVFEDKKDIHTMNTRTVFERPAVCNDKRGGYCEACSLNKTCKLESKITYDERQLGKRACHGINYLMGDITLCDYILKELGVEYAITKSQAGKFRSNYFITYTGVKKFQLMIEQEIISKRMLVNSWGFKRTFYGRPSGKTIRDAIAHMPQSTIAGLTNHALVEVDEKAPEIEFLLHGHDALAIQVDEDKVEWGIAKLRELMDIEITAVYTGMTYKVPVDVKVGKTWGSAKEVK